MRDDERRTADLQGLFHRTGDRVDPELSFEAEMIVPATGYDDLGQLAEASITLLRYRLVLTLRADPSRPAEGLEIISEDLTHINLDDVKERLPFPHSKIWLPSSPSWKS